MRKYDAVLTLKRKTWAHNGTMSASFKSGNVRRRSGPWDMSLLVVLLLVLLSSLTGPVVSQEEEDGEVTTDDNVDADIDADVAPDNITAEVPPVEGTEEVAEGDPAADGDPDATSESPSTDPDASATPDPTLEGDVNLEDASGSGMEGDPTEEVPSDTSPVIILIPVVLVVVIIAMVVTGIAINRRWNRSKGYKTDNEQGDPYLDDDNTEKVPMPMFEEDVPSVLELEMEELDQWMNKDGGLQTTVDSKQIEL